MKTIVTNQIGGFQKTVSENTIFGWRQTWEDLVSQLFAWNVLFPDIS